MKFSKYSIIIDGFPEENKCLVYNTRTQALVCISEELRRLLEYDNGSNALSRTKHYDDVIKMNEMGLVVKDDLEDSLRLDSFFNQIKNTVIEKHLTVSVLTTDACNFNCTYCYQKNLKTSTYMSWEIASQVVEWIKLRMSEAGYDKVYVIFYGGEPLLNKKIIELMATKLKAWSIFNNKKFSFIIQTNGYLLKPNDVKFFKGLGLSQIRISLDGINEEHDKYRSLSNGEKTFEIIFNNILKCIDLVPIGISVSFQGCDISHIKTMIQYFKEKQILNKLSNFIFAPVHPSLGPRGCPEKINNCDHLNNFSDVNLRNALMSIYKLLGENNIKYQNGLAISACPLTRKYGSITVDPRGKIFKCNSMLGHDQFSVGTVFGYKLNKQNDYFLNMDIYKKCSIDCEYLPMCGGGCRMFSYFRTKTFEETVCYKDYLDTMIPELIKNQYAESLQSSIKQKSL